MFSNVIFHSIAKFLISDYSLKKGMHKQKSQLPTAFGKPQFPDLCNDEEHTILIEVWIKLFP